MRPAVPRTDSKAPEFGVSVAAVALGPQVGTSFSPIVVAHTAWVQFVASSAIWQAAGTQVVQRPSIGLPW